MTPALSNILMALTVLALLLGVWWLKLWQQHRNVKHLYVDEIDHTQQRITLLYASQTGTAQHYAEYTQQLLNAQGYTTEILPLDQVNFGLLQQRQTVLWLVSSYGDGDAPDHAQHFQHQLMSQADDLSHLNVALLGFGDRQYRHFCGFAERLKTWLQDANATFLFNPILVDAEHPQDLQGWFEQLNTVFGTTNTAEARDVAVFVPCQLQQRGCLNTAFDDNLFHIRLAAPPSLQWQAGDCVEIFCPSEPNGRVTRFYTIANVLAPQTIQNNTHHPLNKTKTAPSAQQSIELMVRLSEFSTHSGLGYGVGSGYLCRQLTLGDEVLARIHVNPSLHHLPQVASLWLIAAGTGLSGTLAQLRARQSSGCAGNLLLYGERQAQNLQFFQAEIEGWMASGHLTTFDLALSQANDAQATPRYVTALLQARKQEFLAHLDAGGYVYVCGRLDGVGLSVDALLVEWLGQTQVDELKADHRYCRDVY